MRKTGMRFTWETTKNGDAINELKKNGISFEYNHFGELTADFYGIGIFEKVDFEHVQGDVFEICIAQPKRSKIGASAVGWSPGSDDGRPERGNMDDKIQILFELKLAGFDISASLEKMYQKYGKEEFQKAAQTSGYGFIFE